MNREILGQANKLNNEIVAIDKFVTETETRTLALKYILSGGQYSYSIPLSSDLLEIFRTLALSELNNKKESLLKKLTELN